MSFPRYPKYKDSGVYWLGEVPDHWELLATKRLFKLIVEPAPDDNDFELLSIYTDIGVRPRKDLEAKGNKATTTDGYWKVAKGDLIVNKLLAWMGAIGISEYDGVTSPAYDILRKSRQLQPKFYDYLFRCGICFTEFRRHSRGIMDMRLRLYFEDFGQLYMPFPPESEQIEIVAFLDVETAKIDVLVAEQRRLIELLKEKRQAVISHAVTKGLNPHAPLKPSGIEWLGDVPEHWVSGPVKKFMKFRNAQRIPLSTEERSHRQGEFPYYGASGIIDSVDAFIFDQDLVLVSEDGANLVNRATPIAFVASGKYWVNNHAHILEPPDGNTEFWADRIESIDLFPFVTGSAQPKFTAEALRDLMISVPPSESERRAIQRHCRTASVEFDSLTAEAERAIDLLQERRTALISAAVTGKIDVRALAQTEAA